MTRDNNTIRPADRFWAADTLTIARVIAVLDAAADRALRKRPKGHTPRGADEYDVLNALRSDLVAELERRQSGGAA